MKPEELTKENLFAALHGVEMVYFDVRLHETALLVAEEVIFSCHNITFHLIIGISRNMSAYIIFDFTSIH